MQNEKYIGKGKLAKVIFEHQGNCRKVTKAINHKKATSNKFGEWKIILVLVFILIIQFHMA